MAGSQRRGARVSVTALRRALWLVLALTVPLPFFLGEPELAPFARLVFLTGLLGAVFAAEGGGTLGTLVGLGAVQTAGYALVLWLASALAARLLGLLEVPAARGAILAMLAVALLAVALGPIYETPLSSLRPRSSLLGIFD